MRDERNESEEGVGVGGRQEGRGVRKREGDRVRKRESKEEGEGRVRKWEEGE